MVYLLCLLIVPLIEGDFELSWACMFSGILGFSGSVNFAARGVGSLAGPGTGNRKTLTMNCFPANTPRMNEAEGNEGLRISSAIACGGFGGGEISGVVTRFPRFNGYLHLGHAIHLPEFRHRAGE